MAINDPARETTPTTRRNDATDSVTLTAPLPASAPIAEHLLDPLQSPTLQREFPALTTAADAQAMQTHLQEALFDPQRAQITIDHCEVEQVTYIPGAGVIFRYALTLTDQANGGSQAALVSGRVFSAQSECHDYVRQRLEPLVAQASGRPDLALFARPVSMVEQLQMALHMFPIDAELPTLLGVTDREGLRGIFQGILPAAQARIMDVADCQVELVDYGRQYRATLRYHISGPMYNGGTFQQVVYGKLTGDGTGAMAESISKALHDRIMLLPGDARFSVPQVYAWLPQLQLSVLEALPGKALIADMVKGRLRGKPQPAGAPSLEGAIEACGRIAGALHTSRLTLGRRRTLDDELAALGQGAAHMQRISPELGAVVTHWLDRLSVAAARTEPLPPCFNHGDFTHGQLLFDGTTTGLIDFDSVCQAEPALDLGQFLTYLRLASLKSKLTPEATRAVLGELGTRFLETYRDTAGINAGDPEHLATRVQLYRGVSMLRRVVRSWLKCKPARVASALAVLEDELADLP